MLKRTMVLGLVLALMAAAAQAADQPDQVEGLRLAQTNCGACHATGAKDKSPRLNVPPLRDLGARFPVEDMQEALAEGIATGHPEMPQILWEARDIEAFTAYLRSLQPTRPTVKR